MVQLLSQLDSQEWLGLDTEFHRERSYFPELALIQLLVGDQTYLIDPLAIDVRELAAAICARGVIVHAGYQDLEILQRLGSLPAEIFDTQLAAGFCGFGQPSLTALVGSVVGVDLPKGDRLTDWSKRPLTDSQLLYAASDVQHLTTLRNALLERLTEAGRVSWAAEEAAELIARVRDSQVDPLKAWWRLRDARRLKGSDRGVAQELCAWREREAMERNIPVRSVLSDLAIASMAQAKPANHASLLEIRGLDGRSLRPDVAKVLLGCVEAGVALTKEGLLVPPQPSNSNEPRRLISLAQAWVAQKCSALGIEQSQLATKQDLIDFYAGRAGRLSDGWRNHLLDSELRDLQLGKLALALGKGGDLVLLDVSPNDVQRR